MTLTEQWKNGELPFGEYWCKVVGSPYIEQVMSDCMTEEDIVEILDKIPSYREFQQMKAEIASLRELLKECQEIIEWYKADCGYKDLPTESVLTKIDKVMK